MDESLRGWAAVEAALARRTELVLATPDLARVVFSEEQFQGESCYVSFTNPDFKALAEAMHCKGYRVEKAAELLRSTRLKTGEIGLECGFSDGSYFIKTFREIKHCTPREYRQKFAGREQSLSRRDGGRAGAPAETAL